MLVNIFQEAVAELFKFCDMVKSLDCLLLVIARGF